MAATCPLLSCKNCSTPILAMTLFPKRSIPKIYLSPKLKSGQYKVTKWKKMTPMGSIHWEARVLKARTRMTTYKMIIQKFHEKLRFLKEK